VTASKGDSIELTYIFAATESKVRVNLASSKSFPPELRARPVQPPAPTPGADELPPPADENERLNALETRIRELEARVEKLEAASRAKEKP
jgi:hypothetical protein